VDTYDLAITPAVATTFTVAAANSVGTGPASSPPSSAVTASSSTGNPFPPSDITAAANTSGVDVQWNVQGNNGSTPTQFEIQPFVGGIAKTIEFLLVGNTGSSLDPTTGATDHATLTDLTPGTTYTFEVQTTSALGDSGWSFMSNSAVAPTPTTTPMTTVSVTPTQIDFGTITLGDSSTSRTMTVTNTGSITATFSAITLSGTGADDYIPAQDPGTCNTTIPPGASCTINPAFIPGATGARPATFDPAGNWPAGQANVSFTGIGAEGYYIASAHGSIDPFGDAHFFGDGPMGNTGPIVGITQTGDNGGYWLATSTGQIYSWGDAANCGGVTGALNQPIVGIATPDPGGCWLVARDGGIFTFGDASYYGSTGGIRLNQPIVGMASTPDGGGYWLVAADGGIFSFGDAQYHGSTGAIRLNQPIVGMSVTPDGGGYWLVASDGGIFSFGDAQYHGSTGAIRLNQPIVGMSVTPDGGGYWLVARDGGMFTFGDAPYLGSDGATGLRDVVGMAIDGTTTLQSFLNIPADRGSHGWVRTAGGTGRDRITQRA
jgi:hypothetical protein